MSSYGANWPPFAGGDAGSGMDEVFEPREFSHPAADMLKLNLTTAVHPARSERSGGGRLTGGRAPAAGFLARQAARYGVAGKRADALAMHLHIHPIASLVAKYIDPSLLRPAGYPGGL